MTLEEKVEDVLNQWVRPYLDSHGGDLKIISIEDGILTFRMTGMCANCPSAVLTSEEIVKKEILERIPEIKDVVLETGVSEELLDMAIKILSHQKI